MKEGKIVNASDLIQDDHNFNKGTDEGRRLLKESLQKYGAGRSLLIDKDDRIIAGNKTQLQGAELGMKVRIIESDGSEIIAVKRTDVSLDSKQGREMAYLDNLTTQVNLAWDEAEIEQMDVEGFDASQFGVDISKFDNPYEINDTKSKDDSKEVEEDDFDESEVKQFKVKLGDIWQLGDHRLMCGDSTKEEDVAKLMDGEMADLWITDPPYNVDYSEKEKYKKKLGYRAIVHEVAIANDKMSNNDFLQFLINAYKAAKEVMKSGASFYIWHADTEGLNFRIALDKIRDMKLSQTLVWIKNNMVFGRNDYHWRHEPCLYGWKEGAGHNWYSDRSQTTVLEFDRPQKSEEHPTMKPVPLFGYQIKNSTKKGDVVLDNFGGSGTTIIACEQLKRKARVMEYEPHYCDVIIARWEKLTGEKAIKL